MKLMDRAKQKALTQMLKLLPRVSDKNLIRLTYLAERIDYKEGYVEAIKTIRRAFEEQAPAVVLGKRILTKLSPKCRDKLLTNFFVNSALMGWHLRSRFSEQEGFMPPYFMVISPTMRCNLRCVGCYAGDYIKGEELDYQTVSRVITEGYEMGIHFVTISGGEPFLWGDLLRLFREHNDVYFQVYTNGTLIDKNIANELASIGNVAPGISVEGLEKETDERRGKGTFARIITVMESLKENGVMFGFSATPTRYNSDILASDEFIDFYIEKGCYFGWYFQYIPIGRDPDINLMATPQQRNHLREKVNQWRITKPIFIGDFWNDGPYVGGCIAGGRQYFHINNKGDVEPCVFVHFAVDNIKEKSLKEVLNSNLFRKIRERQPYIENLYTPCMIIDNPQVLREIVAITGAHPTHQGAETVISDPRIKAHLDRYAADMRHLTDSLWEKTQEEFYFGRLQENPKKQV